MIYATVIFYDDPPELFEESLQALKKLGFSIICADGAFSEWMKADNKQLGISYSRNGCIDIAKEYCEVYVEAPKYGWLNEMEKRNSCIKYVPVKDYFWINDADEVLPYFELDYLTCDVYRVIERLHRMDGKITEQPRNRVFKMYDDLKFQYQHCRVYRMKQHITGDISSGLVARSSGGTNQNTPIIKGFCGEEICFDHYPYKRSEERQRTKELYCRIRNENSYPF